MKNGWCSGRFELEDGNFITEEDRLNKNSFIVIEKQEQLKKFFEHSNWCLGQAVIFRNLCFIQQVNGGDEWLTIKKFKNETKDFESISFERIINENPKEFEKYIKKLENIESIKEYYGSDN